MYRNSRDDAWCTNPDCRHFSEPFQARWIDDTWEEPGYYLDEECPSCGHPWVAEQLDADALVLDMLVVLEQADLYWREPLKLDARRLLSAIKYELQRQADAERRR